MEDFITLIPDTAKPLAYYDHPLFAKYPAITRNAFGKDTLTYEGTLLSNKLQQSVLLDVLKQAGLTGPDQELPVPVRVKHGSNRTLSSDHGRRSASYTEAVGCGHRRGEVARFYEPFGPSVQAVPASRDHAVAHPS
jgi:hypothetical protein